MLIHNKDDIKFVTEFPCFLGHPVYFNGKNKLCIQNLYLKNCNNTRRRRQRGFRCKNDIKKDKRKHLPASSLPPPSCAFEKKLILWFKKPVEPNLKKKNHLVSKILSQFLSSAYFSKIVKVLNKNVDSNEYTNAGEP